MVWLRPTKSVPWGCAYYIFCNQNLCCNLYIVSYIFYNVHCIFYIMYHNFNNTYCISYSVFYIHFSARG